MLTPGAGRRYSTQFARHAEHYHETDCDHIGGKGINPESYNSFPNPLFQCGKRKNAGSDPVK